MNAVAWTLPFSFEEPAWLWLLLLLPAVVAVSLRVLAGLEPMRRALAVVLRCLVLIALAVCLAGLMTVRTSDKLTVIFLMDRSNSVKDQQEIQEEYLHRVTENIPNAEDRVGMIAFAHDAYLEQLPIRGGYLIPPGSLPELDNRDRTNVAAAIRLALAMFPADSAKRIVLMSDGNDNMGDVVQEASTAQADGVSIDVVPLWYTHRNEVYFDRMVAPTNVEDGDLVPLRMLLHAETPTTGRIDIYHNGRLVELPDDIAKASLRAGSTKVEVKIPVHGGGPQRWEARFVPDDPARDDSIEENNVATAFSFVAGKGEVLVLSIDPSDDQPLVDALRSEHISVEMINVTAAKVDLLELLNYSTVILANVPANTFTDEQHKALAHYVNNLGGGLIMTGGDESFGAGGWIGTPLAEVMPVDFEIKHKRVIPRGALVLIMHSCELPRGNYWGVEIAKKSVDTISSKDYIGVLAYTWSPGGVNWEVPIQLATNKAAIKSRIEKIQIGDMPDFQTTMQMAVKALKATDAAQKHIIMISDGDPSPPATSVIREMTDAKITCSTVAIGYGSHVFETPLKKIAKDTGGRFYPCRNPKTLPQIFVKESKVVRRPLISNEPFRPQVSYAFSELLAGIDPRAPLPVLGGLVLTSPKPEAQTALVRATKDGQDPVLAHWQAGLGKTVAFTSGLWTSWGAHWTSWPAFSKLWAQIVRWSMRQPVPDNFDVFTRVVGNKGRVVVDAMDKDASALNMLQLPATVIRPDQTDVPLVFMQTGPGHYEAEFDVDQTGQYIANVAVSENGKIKGLMQTGAAIPFSPEFRELKTNEALLRQVAEITGGRWHDDISHAETGDVFRHDLPPTLAKQPVWDWAVAWLLLPLFLLDVSNRRLASWVAFSIVVEVLLVVFLLFGAGYIYGPWWGVLGVILLGEVVGWAIRFRSIGPLVDFLTHTVTALGQAGERSRASLGQLKDVRDRVRDGEAPAEAPARPKAEPSVDRSRRFDVGDEAAKGRAGDVGEALGAPEARARADQPKQRPPAAGAEEDEGPQDARSRLLRAKRRARERMKDEEEGKDES